MTTPRDIAEWRRNLKPGDRVLVPWKSEMAEGVVVERKESLALCFFRMVMRLSSVALRICSFGVATRTSRNFWRWVSFAMKRHASMAATADVGSLVDFEKSNKV